MSPDPFSFRDPKRAKEFARLLSRLAPARPVRIVHVCGTHEITITEHGLRSFLPEGVEVLEGPGCPVCVTSTAALDLAVRLAQEGAIVCTFGDMMRVPGTELSLSEARAEGADVRTVLSAADFVIRIDLPGMDMLRFDAYADAIAVGYETAKMALPALEEALDGD